MGTYVHWLLRGPSVAFVFLAVLLQGCASMKGTGDMQAVLVRTQPQGALVRVDGKTFGRTPALVPIRRSISPEVDVELADESVVIPLATRYRWSDSFFPNLVFLQFAPVGWLVDLLTGNAWDIQDSPVVPFTTPAARSAKVDTSKKTFRVAIAPPLAESLGLSDTAGEELQRQLATRAKPGWVILPYRKSLPLFVANHYDFDGAPSSDERRYLHYRLGVDAVFESRVEQNDDGLQVRGELKDVFTEQKSVPIAADLDTEGDLDRTWYKTSRLFSFLPNTIGLDFISENMAYQGNGGETIQLYPPADLPWWEKGLSYLTAVNFSSLPPRRQGRASRWQFTFNPSLRVSRRTVETRGIPALEDQYFTRTWLSLGYGPEVGFQVSSHYFYLQVFLIGAWSEITWTRLGQDYSTTRTMTQGQAEIGYVYFFLDNWHVKLFSRTQQEDNQGWAEALAKNTPLTTDKINGQTSLSQAGLSLGYRFEPRWKKRR